MGLELWFVTRDSLGVYQSSEAVERASPIQCCEKRSYQYPIQQIALPFENLRIAYCIFAETVFCKYDAHAKCPDSSVFRAVSFP